MNGTFMVDMLVWAAIVANHAIYNYSEGYIVTNAGLEKKTASLLSTARKEDDMNEACMRVNEIFCMEMNSVVGKYHV